MNEGQLQALVFQVIQGTTSLADAVDALEGRKEPPQAFELIREPEKPYPFPSKSFYKHIYNKR